MASLIGNGTERQMPAGFHYARIVAYACRLPAGDRAKVIESARLLVARGDES